jgi:ankyrin repeat protein
MKELNDLLMDAVAYHDVEAVRDLLGRGADPNFRTFKDEDEPDGFIQPTTPLRMVMFRISDSLLEDAELREFLKIAQLLLDHGADPGPAMEIAEDRYGKYDPTYESSPFMDVWHVVARAMKS